MNKVAPAPESNGSHPSLTAYKKESESNSKVSLSDEKGGIQVSQNISTDDRIKWGGQLEFILTCVGYAVGLGNVWRFPYLAYRNGGGAFLIPYVIALVFIGIPLFYFEVSFGQFAGLGPITIWRANPFWKGVGYAGVFVSVLIALYYNIIIAYCLRFLIASMTTVLPWTTCNNDWNTCNCVISNFTNTTNITDMLKPVCEGMNITHESNITTIGASEEYFNNFILGTTGTLDPIGGVKWDLCLCLLLAWSIIFLVLIKGIQSLGKVVYFTALFPYVLLTILLVRGLTLPGHADGIYFYLNPRWELLQNARVWSDAAVQIFYSLGACSGGLMAMASYNKYKNNSFRDSMLVPIINCCTSFYAGFVIFSVLGYMADQKGLKVEDVATQGPGLVFVVYPEGLATMPVAPLWAILFFFMMCCLGFSSMFSIMEAVMTAFIDEFDLTTKWPKKWHMIAFRGAVCALFFLLGLPMVTGGGLFLLNLVDTYVSGFPLLFVGLFELVAIMFFYRSSTHTGSKPHFFGFMNFQTDLQYMLGKKSLSQHPIFKYFFLACWTVIAPLMLFAIVIAVGIQYTSPSLGTYAYPDWSVAVGFLIVMFPVICIPIGMVYSLTQQKRWGLTMFQTANEPGKTWGPRDANDYQERYGTWPDWLIEKNNDIAMISKGSTSYVQNGIDNMAYDES